MAVDKTVLFKTVDLGTICIFVKIALLKSASLFLNGKSLNTTKNLGQNLKILALRQLVLKNKFII